MDTYRLELIENANSPGFVMNTGLFTRSIEQLRLVGATGFGIMGRTDNDKAFWEFQCNQGKNLPKLICETEDKCFVRRIKR